MVDKSELPAVLADIQTCLDIIASRWSEIEWDRYLMTRLKQAQKALNDIIALSEFSPKERSTILELRRLKRDMHVLERVSKRNQVEIEELKKTVSLARGV